MLQWVRSTIFNIIFLSGTFLVCLALMPALFLPEAVVRRAFRAWFQALLWCLKYIAGVSYRVRGHIPNTPEIFAAKHQSAFETFALYLLIPNAVFIVKQELLWVPVVGLFFPKQRMIAVGRGAKVSARNLDVLVKERLQGGYSVVLFPEGTRTDPGASPEYRRGIGFLYEKLLRPIYPIAMNSGVFWGRRAWQKKPGCITVSFLPPIAPGLSRDAFMGTLQSDIEGEVSKLLLDVSRETN